MWLIFFKLNLKIKFLLEMLKIINCAFTRVLKLVRFKFSVSIAEI